MIFGEALRGFVLILFTGYDQPDEYRLCSIRGRKVSWMMLSGLKVELEDLGCCLIAWALWPGRVWVAFAPSRVRRLHLGNGSYRDPWLLDCGCSGAQTWRELSYPGSRKPNST